MLNPTILWNSKVLFYNETNTVRTFNHGIENNILYFGLIRLRLNEVNSNICNFWVPYKVRMLPLKNFKVLLR